MAFAVHSLVEGVTYVEIPVSGTTSNIYLAGSPQNYVIIDAGSAGAAAELIETMENAGYRPAGAKAIVITHAHCDHYGSAAGLHDWSGAPVWAHVAAAATLEDPDLAFSTGGWAGNTRPGDRERFAGEAGGPIMVSRMLREGDIVETGGMLLRVIHTPGHEWGSVVLFEDRRGIAFTGDLVQGGIDASANWLGLYTDVARQRKSLARLRSLNAKWLFKGHRPPLSGEDVEKTISSAEKRLDDIESCVLDALAATKVLTLAEATRTAFKGVLGLDAVEPAPYAHVSVNAVLADLARRGLAKRDRNLNWVRA